MKRLLTLLTLIWLSAPALSGPSAAAQKPSTEGDWRAYAGPLLSIEESLSPMLANVDDPQSRHELYRFLYSQLALGYMNLLYADAEYPDFIPYFSTAFNEAFPSPDDAYYFAAVAGDGVYKISGYRGTVRVADLQIGAGPFWPRGEGMPGPVLANYDLKTLKSNKDGYFELVLSGTRPVGYQGNWWKLDAAATYVVARQPIFSRKYAINFPASACTCWE